MKFFGAKALAPGCALVTGAGSGLGRSFCRTLAKQGWKIAVSDINITAAQATLAEVRSEGGDGFVLKLDVTSEKDWLAAKAEIEQRWEGRLDLLVNNAGMIAIGAADKFPLASWRKQIDVNLMGVIAGCHTFIPALKTSKGSLINIASLAGIGVAPEMGAYNATKAGVIALSETLFTELRKDGVSVTVVCPDYFPTALLDTSETVTQGDRRLHEQFMRNSNFTADYVAGEALKGAARRKLYVVLPLRGRFYAFTKRHFPRSYFWFLRNVTYPNWRSRQRKLSENQEKAAE